MNEQTPDVTPFYLDKGLWSLMVAPLFAIINAKFKLGLSAEAFVATVLPVVAYIVSHKWKTGTLAKARIESAPISEPPKTDTEAAAILGGVK